MLFKGGKRDNLRKFPRCGKKATRRPSKDSKKI
jgi:hypothetical protein